MRRRDPGVLLIVLVLGGLVAAATPRAGTAQQVYVTSARPAWLGVGYDVQWIQEEGRCEPQVRVQDVVQGSPAERAGLRSGDVIVALAGEPIPAGRLGMLATQLEPGDSVPLRVLREGRVRELVAVAGRRPERPPSIVIRSSGEGLTATPGPLVRVEGERLVLRNVDAAPTAARGYWLATADGEAEYRRLGTWSRNELDERVTRLLRCVEEVDWAPAAAPSMDLHAFQRRADSLRITMARRALEREPEPPAALAPVPGRPPVPGVPGRLQPAPARIEVTTQPDGYTFRFEDHLSAGLRGVAGAEITALEPELAAYFRNVREGLLVLRVAPGTPAERAGLRPGDVIVSAGARSVDSVAGLRGLLDTPDPTPLTLRIVRRGVSRSLTLDRQ